MAFHIMGRGYATVPPEHDLRGRAGFRIPAVRRCRSRDEPNKGTARDPFGKIASIASDFAERFGISDVFAEFVNQYLDISRFFFISEDFRFTIKQSRKYGRNKKTFL